MSWEQRNKEFSKAQSDAQMAYIGAEREVRRLASENVMLRKLVWDMHRALFSLNLDHCQACPREDACVSVHKSFDCDDCSFERDMRELGIEVSG